MKPLLIAVGVVGLLLGLISSSLGSAILLKWAESVCEFAPRLR